MGHTLSHLPNGDGDSKTSNEQDHGAQLPPTAPVYAAVNKSTTHAQFPASMKFPHTRTFLMPAVNYFQLC